MAAVISNFFYINIRAEIGITLGLLRLSVGIEDIEDLKADILCALSSL